MNPPGHRPRQAALLVLGASLGAQAGSALATRLFTLVSPAGAASLRLLGAAAVLTLAAGGPAAIRRRVPREALSTIAGLGLASAAMNICFYEAISRIPLGPAVTVEFLGPIALAALASHRRADVGWALLALAGVALVSEGLTGEGGATGIGFALAAGVFWALYLTFARRLGHGGTGLAGLAASLVVGAVAAAPILAVSHPAAADLPVALGLGLVLGTLSTALVYALEIAALRRASITVVGVLLALDPAVAAVIGFIALDQGLTLVQLAGIALVIAAGAGVVRGAAAPSGPAGTGE